MEQFSTKSSVGIVGGSSIRDGLNQLGQSLPERLRVLIAKRRRVLQLAFVACFSLVFGLFALSSPILEWDMLCLLYTSPSPRDRTRSRMPSSA